MFDPATLSGARLTVSGVRTAGAPNNVCLDVADLNEPSVVPMHPLSSSSSV